MAENEASHRSTGELAGPEDRGRTIIADKVVERVASIAASEVEAITESHSGWARIVSHGLPRAHAVVAGDTTRIKVEVAAVWPSPLAKVASRVRDHVGERVASLTGIKVSAVDVSVADVVHGETARRRVE